MTADQILKTYIRLIFIATLAIIVYLPTFSGDFILDDDFLIKNNEFIREPNSLSEYLSQEDGLPDKTEQSGYHPGYYRPLINLSYRMDYKLWGLNPGGFRTTSLILHTLCCLLIYAFINHFVGSNGAFWAVTLFCLHPVNTESVSFISSRNNMIVSFFALSSVLFYVTGWERKNYLYYAASILSFAGAVFSKEFGLMILPVLFLHQRLLCRRKDRFITEIMSYIPFVIISVIYLLLRTGVTGYFLSQPGSWSLWERLYFVPYILIRGFELIFFPHDLHFFIESYPPFFSLYAIVSLLIFLLICAIIYLKRRNRTFLFSVLSFFVFMVPVLGIIPTSSNTVFCMRWLYLPMIFLFIGLGAGIQYLLTPKQQLASALLIMFAAYYGTYAFVLNKGLWHKHETLVRQETLRFDNRLLYSDMAVIFYNEQNNDAAEKYFRLAIEKMPSDISGYNGFSNFLTQRGRPEAAVFLLDKAKGLKMTWQDRGQLCNNMGVALLRMGDKESALKWFKKAVIYAPGDPLFYANLGGAYGLSGEHLNSIIVLKKGLETSPDAVQLWQNLAIAYINLKEYQDALSALESIPEKARNESSEVMRLWKMASDGLLDNENNSDISDSGTGAVDHGQR